MAEKKVKKYVSDNAQLMQEWNLERNLDMDPSKIMLGSHMKVWWKCCNGHEWQAMTYNRAKGIGCPYCSGRKVLVGYNDLQTVNECLANEWNYEKNSDLSPENFTANSGKKVWWKCSEGHEWQAIIGSRSKGHGCPYCAGQRVIKGKNDLQTMNESLTNEWNYEKNASFSPEHISANSHKKVWWKCSEGHEWQATIDNRNKGRGCPYCSGRKVLVGYNDLQTVNESLAEEWNYEKNGELMPEHFVANSKTRVWWKCCNGHEWQATIINRNRNFGCPYCSGQKVLVGYNDLQALNPKLANEWNYEKNGSLRPEHFTVNSGKKVWWKCKKGHEWQAVIAGRNSGTGCPTCSSERHTSFQEYAIVYYLRKYGLEIIQSYKENGYELDVYVPSKKIAIEYDGYYWHKDKKTQDLEKNYKCKKDGIVLYRIREGLQVLNDSSIDYVVQENIEELSKTLADILGKIIGINIDVDLKRDFIEIENLREYTEKENSFLFSNPKKAEEWNYEKNGSLRPEHFTSNSGKKVWWKCKKGHEWQAVIAHRNRGRGCPYCSGYYVVKGENDLQTVNFTLAMEWDLEKNNRLTPAEVSANSGKKVWWKCSEGHEWQATIGNRSKGRGCPYCSGRKVLVGYNDLQTVNESLAEEWNYEKNKSFTPSQVSTGSNKKAWWKCRYCGNEWEARIASRNIGQGCPKCARARK